jgi:cytosine/adenosine deaminase-related metal-dependent hydrolase
LDRLILHGGLVATMDSHRHVFDPGTVVVEDGTIVEVTALERGTGGDLVLDCRGKMVLPGLVNVHAHATEVLFRGCANELPFLQWLFERNHPLLERMDEGDAHIAALLCALEMLTCGTTCYLDPEVWPEQYDGVAAAMDRAGLRACLALAMEGQTGYASHTGGQLGSPGPGEDLERARRWHEAAGGRIRVWLGPRVLSAVDQALAELLKRTAAEWRTGVTVHFAEVPEDVSQIREEYGLSPSAYLEGLGLLGPNVVLTHAIRLEPEDIGRIAQTGTRIAHCPASNMKVGNGFAPIPELLAEGVLVGLGTDGGMCNDTYDLLREMGLAALIHKGRTRDPQAVPAERVLAMATCEGAQVLGLADEIGSLERGKRADVVVVSMQDAGWWPIHDPFANLVYGSVTRDHIETVVVDGQLLVRGGEPLHLDMQAILREAQSRSEAIIEAAGLADAVRSPWMSGKHRS